MKARLSSDYQEPKGEVSYPFVVLRKPHDMGRVRKSALWLIELAKISQIDGADLSAPDKANSADFACATKALLSLDYQKLGRGGTPPRFGDRKPYKVVVYYLH